MMFAQHQAPYPQAMAGVRAAVNMRARLLQWLGRALGSFSSTCPEVMSAGLRAARDGDLEALQRAVGVDACEESFPFTIF